MIKTYIVQIDTDTDLSQDDMFTIIDDGLMLTENRYYYNNTNVVDVKEITNKGE